MAKKSVFEIENNVLLDYRGNASRVVIPKHITVIEELAFLNCDMTEVVFPKGLQCIKDHAFSSCPNLEKIILPEGLDYIGRYAFANCSNAEVISIPSTATKIESGAFADLPSIKELKLGPALPDEKTAAAFLRRIFAFDDLLTVFLTEQLDASDAFQKALCRMLTAKNNRHDFFRKLLDSGEYVLAEKLISHCRRLEVEELDGYIACVDDVSLKLSLIHEKNRRFPPKKLEKIAQIEIEKEMGLREKTMSDWRKIFQILKRNDCYEITEYKKNDPAVVIPGRLNGLPVKIGSGVFRYHTELRTVIADDGIIAIGNDAFFHCTSLKEIVIPDTVKTIGNMAFMECRELEKAILPKDVSVGNSAFSDCRKLGTVIAHSFGSEFGKYVFVNTPLPYDENGFCTIGGVLLHYSSRKDKARTRVLCIPEGIVRIASEALRYNIGIEEILLPATLQVIDAYAFAQNKYLSRIVIPANVTEMGEGVFEECESLRSVTIEGKLEYLADRTFYKCEMLTEVILPDTIRSIGNHAFTDCIFEQIEIPEGVVSIGGEAFCGCNRLHTLNLPEGLIEIGERAFAYCDQISRFVIPEGVDALLSGTFFACDGMKELILPDKSISIASDAFACCNGLESRDGWISVRSLLVAYVGEASCVTIPQYIRTIGCLAFDWCDDIEKIVIPKHVKEIGYRAFNNCVNLQSVTFENPKIRLHPELFSSDTKAMLRGHIDSTADRYAMEKEMSFQCIGDDVKKR
ncbi:MAG: leucine-rich repeat protein [Clostridia bacterium]|nr:leucine-rich repeat protein [Clostridia bacterium]